MKRFGFMVATMAVAGLAGCLLPEESGSGHGGSTTSTSGGTAGTGAGGDSGGGGTAAGGGGSGGTGGTGGTGGMAPSDFACPLDNGKPQLAYGAVGGTLGGSLEKDETWTADNVYLVFGGFSTGAHTLTIEAGTVVCFDDDQLVVNMPPPGQLGVDTGGALRALGTPDQHVVFTQRNGGGASWSGISFGYGFDSSTSLKNLDVYRAGQAGPALRTLSEGAAGINADPALELADVGFYQVVNKAVQIGGSNGLTPNSRVRVHQYVAENNDPATQYPVLTYHPLATAQLTKEMFQADSPGVPEAARVIALGEGIIPKSSTLHDIGLPYRTGGGGLWIYGDGHLENGGPSARLTVDPGVTLQIRSMIYIGYHQNGGGDIVAAGTAGAPITFTGVTAAEPWDGMLFEMRETDTSITKLDHVILENAGAPGLETIYNCQDGTGSSVGGMVNLRKPPNGVSFAGPPITNTTFRTPTNDTDAVRAECQVADDCITTDYTDPAMNNTFEGFDDPCTPSDPTSQCAQRPLGCP